MSRILNALATGMMYFCVATVLAAVVGFAMLYQKGAFNDGRVLNMWASMHGLDVSLADHAAQNQETQEYPSYDDVLNKRMLVSLDLDLRENAIEKTLAELRATEAKIRTERDRFDRLVTSFDQKIKDLESNATDEAILETQQTLEALPPKQAKQQLLNLLEGPPSPGIENPVAAVVSLVKAMPIEKRRRILAEFRSEEEETKLSEILQEILRGAPDVPLLRQARDELQKVSPERK
jgi:hypothetical protein